MTWHQYKNICCCCCNIALFFFPLETEQIGHVYCKYVASPFIYSSQLRPRKFGRKKFWIFLCSTLLLLPPHTHHPSLFSQRHFLLLQIFSSSQEKENWKIQPTLCNYLTNNPKAQPISGASLCYKRTRNWFSYILSEFLHFFLPPCDYASVEPGEFFSCLCE